MSDLAKLAEIDRVIAEANYFLRLQGMRAVPCPWKVEAFLNNKTLPKSLNDWGHVCWS